MKKILVTGGAGYIGSFIVRDLKDKGFKPIIVDDMSSGHAEAIEGFPLHKINIATEKEKLEDLVKKEEIDGVIHMAGFIQMGESFENPHKYFENNLLSAANLLDVMVKNKVNNIVFSSSAGVYGNPEKLPIKEENAKVPENPYGETKLMIEKMLNWFDKSHGIRFASIRYFNASGAALNGSIGEDHPDESHLIPLAIKAAMEGKELTVFGDDYDTPDGTNVRDYVHVLDLSQAHTLALKELLGGAKSNYYNAGGGKGYSNKEIVEMINKVTNLNLKVKYGERRPGDADSLYASIEKIEKDLDWKPKYGLKEIVESAYKWHKRHPEGYKE